MKKIALLAVISLATATSGFAQTEGTFGYGIEILGSGAGAANSGTLTLYALDSGGGNALLPTSSSATLSTAWTAASSGLTPTYNLGSFASGNTLTLTGGSLLTFQNSGSTVNTNNVYLNYGVTLLGQSVSFAPGINLPLNVANIPGGNAGDDRFSLESDSINLLSGLAPGTYELETYGYADGLYESDSGNNFAAVFTVDAVPEPSTWALMVGSLGLLLGWQRLRRQSAR